MTKREKNLFFETLELLRKELRQSDGFRGKDWRDVDDWLFSELPFTKGELREIYQGRGVQYDATSAVPTACAYLAQFIGCELRLCRNSGYDNEFGPSCEVYAMVEGMPTLFTSQQLPIISKYIGQTPRLEKNQWTGDISLWFGDEKIWDTQDEKAEEAALHILQQVVDRFAVKSKTVNAAGIELTAEFRIKDAATAFINQIHDVSGVENAILVSYNGEYMS